MQKIYTTSLAALLLHIVLPRTAAAEDFSRYFPLHVGDNWQYRYEETKTIYALPDSTFGAITIGGLRYYLWGDKGGRPIYIRQDEEGRIFRRIKNHDRLWFDFTKNDGDSYTWSSDGENVYRVTVRKNRSLTTYAGQFTDCIEFFFDNPAMADEEKWYVFAPEVGLVKKQYAWVTMLLVSAQVDRRFITRAKETKANRVEGFSLAQNYPNPFNPTTFIKFALPQETTVMLDIFDLRGYKVRSLVSTRQTPGEYIVMWDGTDETGHSVNSGIYTYRLVTDGFMDVKRMVVLR